MAEQSRLHALPRELRNNIYAFLVMGEGRVRVKKATAAAACPFAISSPLILSCTQIHDEYCEDFLANIFGTESNIKIEVIVTALDFTPALNFLRNLQPAQLAHIKAQNVLDVLLVYPSLHYSSTMNEWSGYCKQEAVTVLYTIDDKRSSASDERNGHRSEPLLRIHHSEGPILRDALMSAWMAWHLRKLREELSESLRVPTSREAFSQRRLSKPEPVSAAAKSASAITQTIHRKRRKRPARQSSLRPTLMVVVGGVRRWREVVQPE
ncbi:hypothetical protein LTR97_003930 [Elasticomyces elasticus]|uniref:Uncharacterized protein n=1 Tax=Elasticomyces elasticus TaxID=574655 RepID=A0AAN7VUM6_9PEZI|nr:hypothetical protein LTR97_003930 [Elasticomyces elasticus]